MRLLLAALAVLAAACGTDPNVGATCALQRDCDEGLLCETAVSGGYCTAACTTPGSASDCPDGSICDALGAAQNRCVRICQVQSDCRADLECNGITGSSVKGCKPK